MHYFGIVLTFYQDFLIVHIDGHCVVKPMSFPRFPHLRLMVFSYVFGCFTCQLVLLSFHFVISQIETFLNRILASGINDELISDLIFCL